MALILFILFSNYRCSLQWKGFILSKLAAGFLSLPLDFQRVIQLAQDQHNISVTPLQQLSGGWSGALIYLASVVSADSGPVQHFILKLDHKSKNSKSDEVSRHAAAQSKSPPEFARDHLANLAFAPVEAEGAIGIFYTIAGQSLQAFRPLSNYGQQEQLETIFAATHHFLLDEWNPQPTFFQAIHPQELLAKWLGFRLEPGAPIERFIGEVCRARSDSPGFLIQGNIFPNPLWYARHKENWGSPRPIDAIVGLQHGDLNTNNILVKFSENERELAGFYLIDFALFKDKMPLLYDLRYQEMSYLILAMSQIPFAKVANMMLRIAETEGLDPHKASIEMAGASAVIRTARNTFAGWLTARHASLHDDLWGQYWLAGAAAGLSYCHKAGQPNEQRLAGLIFAAANLKRYMAMFAMPLPTEVELLYDEGQSGHGAQDKPIAKEARHNLPNQPTPFIGRARQIASIKELLLSPDVRLLTLIGPGGTGKTRLSLQAAREVLDQFQQGVCFVPLADDTDPDQFISRVAQHLEVREGGRPMLENVKDYLRDKHLLLVLDNFEQLLPAAPVAAELLAEAPQLKMLVSSRIALNLHGEREFPVPPLDLPEGASESTARDLAANESILLFVERARAVQPNFALTDDNSPAVAQICKRLDGLPLAIELAAARIKLLPPQAILRRLDDRLKLLTGGARDLPTRHQTIRNTLEWSYGLLNPEEKTLYARLGVFVGGFTLEAAEAVCNREGSLDILEGVTSLVNNSLLRQEDTGEGEPRFGMLETIRAYSLERLAASGEMETLRKQHAQHFGNVILNQMGLQLFSASAPYWLNWLEREHDNIRATLAWSLSTPEGVDLAAGLVFALNWFWYRRGYLMEGHAWAEKALALPALQTPSPLRALALHSSGLLAIWQGKQDIGLAELQESLAIEQRHEDAFRVAALSLVNGVAFINMGRDSAAQPLLEEAGRFFKEQNQPYFHIFALVHLGNAELGLGHPGQARAWLEEALSEARALGETWVLTFALNNLGEVARTLGEYDRARRYYEESEVLLRRSGDKGDLARLVHTLGYIALYEGDIMRAENQFSEALVMFRQLGNRRGIAECLAGLAGLRARQGQAGWGAKMLGAADTLLRATGGAWWPADRLEVERNQEIMRSALGEDEFAAAWNEGKSMTLEQAITFTSNES
jgi:predicted ATPase